MLVSNSFKLYFAVLTLLFILTRAEKALGVDPYLRYKVFETENFIVHFPEGGEEFAFRAGATAELAHLALVPYFELAPTEKTVLLILDDVDAANGAANAVPYNRITIYATPPDSEEVLNTFDDWLFSLIVHEYAHILHLDTIGGIPNAINEIFGKIYAPNIVQPRFVVEGLAVYIESRLSPPGRNHSSMHKMYARTLALEGKQYPLDVAANIPFYYPYGNIWYLYGGLFMQFIAARYGEEALRTLAKEYGSNAIPYALNSTFKKATGKSLTDLWKEWQEYDRGEAIKKRAEILASPLREGRPLTRYSDVNAFIKPIGEGKRFYYLRHNRDTVRAQIMVADIEGEDIIERQVTEINGTRGFDVSSDEKFLVASEIRILNEYYNYYDLALYTLGNGGAVTEKRWLTDGMRARKPALSPDNRRVVFISSTLGRTRLCFYDLEGSAVSCPFTPSDRYRIDAPAFSPDGKSVYIALAEVGENLWELYRYDVESEELFRLTFFNRISTNPFVAADGGWLLFQAEPDGVYNGYALKLESGELFKLTNVITGAFEPKMWRGANKMLFRRFGLYGYRVCEIDFEPIETGVVFEPQKAVIEEGELRAQERYEFKDYNPLPTLKPQYWAPVMGYDSQDGYVAGLQMTGADLLSRHAYAFQLLYSAGYEQLLGYAAYTNRMLRPYISLDANRFNRRPTNEYFRFGRFYTFEEKVFSSSVKASVPFSHYDYSQNIYTAYIVEWLSLNKDFNYPIVFDPLEPAPILPEFGRLATLRLGYELSTVRASGAAISPERGIVFNVRLNNSHPIIASEFQRSILEFSLKHYLLMPWLEHNVWAARVAGGAGIGDFKARRLFYVGGNSQSDLLLSMILGEGGVREVGYLRGFPPSAFAVNQYAVLNNDYRLPFWRIYRGFWTLPVFLREIAFAAFFDVGVIGGGIEEQELLHASAGGELDFRFLLSYLVSADLRIGYAKPLTDGFPTAFYLLLGGGF
ncbi:MAG: hypothetical protein Kow0090_16830 [Myxococcota bacterium]